MRLSRPSLVSVCPCLALPMSLLLIAGIAGCGAAPSDNAPTLDSRASHGEPPLSQKNPSPRTDLIASVTSHAKTNTAPLGSENRTGNSPHVAPASSTKPVNPMDMLDVPTWIIKDLASPDVETRLRALNAWVLTAPAGSIDPLILAYGTDDDERVQARAMELIEQDWARAADSGQ